MQKTHRTTYYKYIKTHLPYCDKVLASANDTPLNGLRLSHLVLKEQPLFDSLPSTYIEHENLALFLTLEHQLNAYAQGTLSQFTIPLDLEGTLHQQKIWALLQQIPYGKTCSYKDIAQKAGSSPRAIGGANRKNRIPIIVPCHRVIKHDGSLGGYFGKNTNNDISVPSIKQALIQLENALILFIIV